MDQSAVRRWGVLAHDSIITTPSLTAQHVRNYQDFFMLDTSQRQQATLFPLANCKRITFVKKNNQQIRNDCYNVFLAHKDQRPIVVWV